MPIQGRLKEGVEGWIELEEKYAPVPRDLEGFGHLILIYHSHRSDREEL